MADIQLKQQFAELKTNYDRVTLFLSFSDRIKQIDRWFDSLNFRNDVKNDTASAKCREDGNNFYKTGHFQEARTCYTKAIMFATCHGSDLAQAYGNRAAVSFSMFKNVGFVKRCIIDCDRAVDSGYPEGLVYKIYGRKANALMELGEYKQCLALLYTAGDYCTDKGTCNIIDKRKFMDGIATRIKKCELMIASGVVPLVPDMETRLPPIEISSVNKKYLGASNQIHFKTRPSGNGRNFIVTEDVTRNDCLLSEKPYCFVLNKIHIVSKCSFCYSNALAGIPCKYCIGVIYCNEYCLNSDWKEKHQRECGLISHLYDEFTDEDIIAYRILAKTPWATVKEVESQKSGDIHKQTGCYDSSHYNSVFSCATNEKRFSTKQMLTMTGIAFKMLLLYENRQNVSVNGTFLKPVNDRFCMSQFRNGLREDRANELLLRASVILRHLQQCWSGHMVKMKLDSSSFCDCPTCSYENGFNRCRHVLSDGFIGYGCYPTLSLINYGCNNNICMTFDNDRLSYFAENDLKPGVELFSSYDTEFGARNGNTGKCFKRGKLGDFCECPVCTQKVVLNPYKGKWLCDLCWAVIDEKYYVCQECGEHVVDFQSAVKLQAAMARFQKGVELVCTDRYKEAILELCDFIDDRRSIKNCVESPLIVKAWGYLANAYNETGNLVAGKSACDTLLEYLERPSCSPVLKTLTGYAVRLLFNSLTKLVDEPTLKKKEKKKMENEIMALMKRLQEDYPEAMYPEEAVEAAKVLNVHKLVQGLYSWP